MKRLPSSLRLFALYFRLNLASAMEYRSSFLASAFGMALSNGTFVFFWWMAFDLIGGRIGGYDFADVMFIWATSSSAFGVAYIVFGNLGRIGQTILNGDLDTYLLQPRNALLSLICSRTEFTAWGDLLYGVVLMALTNSNPASWLAYGLGVLFGSVMFAATAILFHSLTFFFGDASLASGMAVEFVINFCLYPEGIYHRFVRLIMYSAIPAAYIAHVPLKLARGGSPLWGLALIGYTALYSCAAMLVFRKGLKRYESGNLIATRM